MIACTLTFPPSVNRLYRTYKGRIIKSAVYRAWQAENRNAAPWATTITGPYELQLVATAPDKRRRDLGNLEKSVSDLLQALGLISDDCNAKRLVIEWGEAERPGVDITIIPLEAR